MKSESNNKYGKLAVFLAFVFLVSVGEAITLEYSWWTGLFVGGITILIWLCTILITKANFPNRNVSHISSGLLVGLVAGLVVFYYSPSELKQLVIPLYGCILFIITCGFTHLEFRYRTFTYSFGTIIFAVIFGLGLIALDLSLLGIAVWGGVLIAMLGNMDKLGAPV